MIDIKQWMDEFLQKLYKTFSERISFVGLQGSYGRGEANESSDIDVVVILDKLSTEDIHCYNAMLDTLPHRELICGFLSGKDELLNWEASDLFQFYHDTTPVYGSVVEILPNITEEAVDRAIKIGACNLYHGCVHNILHDKNDDILRGLYKSASFVVQAIVFKQTGKYVKYQSELLETAMMEERHIIEICVALKNGGVVEFESMSDVLFRWAQKWINR